MATKVKAKKKVTKKVEEKKPWPLCDYRVECKKKPQPAVAFLRGPDGEPVHFCGIDYREHHIKFLNERTAERQKAEKKQQSKLAVKRKKVVKK